MKSLLLVFFVAALSFSAQTQVSVNAVGSAPHPSAMLDVQSGTKGALLPRMTYAYRMQIPSPAQGLTVYQTNDSVTARGFYVFDGTWKGLAKVEDAAWTRNGASLYTNLGGQVGIGTSTPDYRLDVNGSVRAEGNGYIQGSLGIGTTSPGHKLQVNDGAIALHNTIDLKTWYLHYNNTNHYFQIVENGNPRFVIANGGNVGIGTITPSARLEVNGNAEVSGSLTVQGGKGILYNTNGSPLRYYTREALFTVNNLGPHARSAEASIGFGLTYSKPPAVFVANIVANSGSGPLHQLQLVIYDVTTTGCKCRLINNSGSAISQTCTWNIVCIGS